MPLHIILKQQNYRKMPLSISEIRRLESLIVTVPTVLLDKDAFRLGPASALKHLTIDFPRLLDHQWDWDPSYILGGTMPVLSELKLCRLMPWAGCLSKNLTTLILNTASEHMQLDKLLSFLELTPTLVRLALVAVTLVTEPNDIISSEGRMVSLLHLRYLLIEVAEWITLTSIMSRLILQDKICACLRTVDRPNPPFPLQQESYITSLTTSAQIDAAIEFQSISKLIIFQGSIESQYFESRLLNLDFWEHYMTGSNQRSVFQWPLAVSPLTGLRTTPSWPVHLSNVSHLTLFLPNSALPFNAWTSLFADLPLLETLVFHNAASNIYEGAFHTLCTCGKTSSTDQKILCPRLKNVDLSLRVGGLSSTAFDSFLELARYRAKSSRPLQSSTFRVVDNDSPELHMPQMIELPRYVREVKALLVHKDDLFWQPNGHVDIPAHFKRIIAQAGKFFFLLHLDDRCADHFVGDFERHG